MRTILICCEWLFGLLVAILSIFTILFGLIVGLGELPRYFRNKAM